MRPVALAVFLVLAMAPVLCAQSPAPAPAAPGVPTPAPPAAPQTPPTPAPAPPGGPPSPVAGRVLTLDEAIAIALEGQPQIQARLFDYAAARYRVNQALSPLLPQLAFSWTTSRSESVSVSTSTTAASTAITVSRDFADTSFAQVQLSQLLFDFGKTFAATEASRRLAEVAREDVELQRQLITLTVKESYTNILFSERLIRVQQQALDRAELNLRSARGFYEVGTRPRSDVTRAEVDVANARVDLIRARNAANLGRVALNTAMGIPADTPTQIVDNLAYQEVQIDRARLLDDALRQRPEYRQANLQATAAEALVRQTFRNFFPDVTGSGSYGAQRSTFDEAWSVTLALNWPIFDGGNRIARHQEAKANLEGARARVKAQALQIAQDVEQAQFTIAETRERIQAAQAAVASALENFRLAQGRFDAGVGTILELTDAQLALTQAQNTEAQALADYRIALARLDRAVGRR